VSATLNILTKAIQYKGNIEEARKSSPPFILGNPIAAAVSHVEVEAVVLSTAAVTEKVFLAA